MNKSTGAGIGVGIAIGVALGVALGNIAVGIAIGIVLGVAIDRLYMDRQKDVGRNSDTEADLHSAQNNTVNAARSAEKDAHVARVLAVVREKGSITNHEVRELLGVSDATAERYLEELEKSGAIAQVGKTGNAVSYKAL